MIMKTVKLGVEIDVRSDTKMTDLAKSIVHQWNVDRWLLSGDDDQFDFREFVVWQCKILQNWKWLIATTRFDGYYFEVTFDGSRSAFYLDVYEKQENIEVIRDEN